MSIIDPDILFSSILLITSIPILWIGLFFFMQPKNAHFRLKNIMTHIFIAWGIHFTVVGLQVLFEVVFGHRLLSQPSMRMVSALFVLIEFIALLRLYVYIRSRHD